MERRRCTTPEPNRLRGAVAGNTGDHRRIRLTGIESLDDVEEMTAHVWAAGDTDSTECDVVEVADEPAVTVEVDLGEFLADAAPGDYLFEIDLVDGSGEPTTWPQESPATLTVRASRPTPP